MGAMLRIWVEQADVNRAFDLAGQAVETTSQGQPDRANVLNSVGALLGRRLHRTGSLDDLNHAVDTVSQAVDATPQDHPDRADRLNLLGIWHGTRYIRTGSMDDLNRAIDVAGQAVDATGLCGAQVALSW